MPNKAILTREVTPKQKRQLLKATKKVMKQYKRTLELLAQT